MICQNMCRSAWSGYRVVTAGKGRAHASVEMLRETLHHRIRRTGDLHVAAAEVRDVDPIARPAA